jgi:Aspartyl protease
MRPLTCLCALLLGTTLAARAQSATPTTPPMTHAKLSSCDGLPCIDAQTGGKHLRLAIDSGDPNSVLDVKVAQTLGLTLQPVNGEDGKPITGYQQATATNLVIDGITFKKIDFLIIDLSKAMSTGTIPHVDGTLAYGDFKDRILQLDYPAGTLSLSDPLTTPTKCPSACGDISLITFGHHGPPIVTTTGFTVNGKPIAVQIDTMFSGTLLIYPTSVDKLGLATEAQSKTSEHFPFTDGGVDMFQSKASKVGFDSRTLTTQAPLYFAGPKVHLPDGLFDGTVGAALLVTHKITFNFHDNKFWLD